MTLHAFFLIFLICFNRHPFSVPRSEDYHQRVASLSQTVGRGYDSNRLLPYGIRPIRPAGSEFVPRVYYKICLCTCMFFVSRFEDYHQCSATFCKATGWGYDPHFLLHYDLCSICASGISKKNYFNQSETRLEHIISNSSYR